MGKELFSGCGPASVRIQKFYAGIPVLYQNVLVFSKKIPFYFLRNETFFLKEGLEEDCCCCC